MFVRLILKKYHPCIYTIQNLVNNKIYVGGTINFLQRKIDHLKKLRHNKHENRLLLADFNIYKEENFKFEILEECERDFLLNQEHYWCNLLNAHNIDFGYNIKTTHPYKKNSRLSERTKLAMKEYFSNNQSLKGYKHTEETKRKMSEAAKLRQQNISKETKRKISESLKNII